MENESPAAAISKKIGEKFADDPELASALQSAIAPDSRQRSAQVLYVPAGKYSAPIPKFLYRLRAPLRWWKRSTARIMALEVCNLPARMVASRRILLDLRKGLPFQFDIPANMVILLPVHMLPRFYTQGMEKLQTEQTVSLLDQQVFYQAFRAGVESALRIVDKQMTHKESA